MAISKRNAYTDDWPKIARAAKEKHGWKCERCGHKHEVITGYVLTVHHLDGNKSNNLAWNLAVLCQRCHLSVQGRVRMGQMTFDFMPISKWFVPHLKGYLKHVCAKERLPGNKR